MSQTDTLSIHFQSEKLNQLKNLVLSLIPIESNLHISGPSGSGKTSWSNTILDRSGLKEKCARIDVKELDEELFKDVLSQNSFRHLLIENIEYLHKENQNILVQYINKNSVTSRPVIITTSLRGLKDLALEGQIRQDLYYKLTVFSMELPALKEIADDIPTLANFYLEVFSILYKKNSLKFTAEAMEKLKLYFWPGNISELESVIERAVLLGQEDQINDKHIRFDEFKRHAALDLSLGMSLGEVERRLILQTLEHTANNRTKAAHILGISIRTLRNKINEYREAGLM